MSVVVVATITPLPQHRQDVRTALLEAVAAVHSERGCDLYALHDAGPTFVMIEQWESESSLKHHTTGEAVRTLNRAIGDKLKEPVSLVVSSPLPSGVFGKGQLVR